MRDIFIIGTHHIENQNSHISSEILLQIVSEINPDLLMVECPIDEYEKYKDQILNPQNSNSLEANFFKKYLALNKIEVKPYDMEKINQNRGYRDENNIGNVFDYLATFHDVELINELADLQMFITKVHEQFDYTLLNSRTYDSLTEKQRNLWNNEIQIFLNRNNTEMAELFKAEKNIHYLRESEMARNVLKYSKGYKCIVVLTGLAHRFGLISELSKMKSDTSIVKYLSK